MLQNIHQGVTQNDVSRQEAANNVSKMEVVEVKGDITPLKEVIFEYDLWLILPLDWVFYDTSPYDDKIWSENICTFQQILDLDFTSKFGSFSPQLVKPFLIWQGWMGFQEERWMSGA